MHSYVEVNDRTHSHWKSFTKRSHQLISLYGYLIDSYVLDFFSEDIWQKLPGSWRNSLDTLTLRQIASFLTPPNSDNESRRLNAVLPLSLLSLRAAAFSCALPRHPVNSPEPFIYYARQHSEAGQHRLLNHVFRRHVKPKKQHEVARVSLVTALAAQASDTDITCDVGSGCGHLARLLSYGHHLRVVCLEKQEEFIEGARLFDKQLEKFMQTLKRGNKEKFTQLCRSSQVNIFEPNIDCNEDSLNKQILQEIKSNLPLGPRHANCVLRLGGDVEFLEEGRFGLTGLHTCGDLAAILLDTFVRSPSCRFIVSVPCCYMKLSTDEGCVAGFPLSEYLRREGVQLSYSARELACHAIESYCDKLATDVDNLKVHCYRAVLERIIVQHWPHHKRAGLRSVKRTGRKAFHEYAVEAVASLHDVVISVEDLHSSETLKQLSRWKQVVAFYSLRLLLAPVIETLLLLDRSFFLFEREIDNVMVPVFDPALSPRNMLLFAIKSPKL